MYHDCSAEYVAWSEGMQYGCVRTNSFFYTWVTDEWSPLQFGADETPKVTPKGSAGSVGSIETVRALVANQLLLWNLVPVYGAVIELSSLRRNADYHHAVYRHAANHGLAYPTTPGRFVWHLETHPPT